MTDSGFYKKFFLRDFNYSEEDISFTYELLQKRLSKEDTIIKYITNTTVPTIKEHTYNLHNKFKTLKIMMIDQIHVGFMPIDNNSFFGMFYSVPQLRKAKKLYNLDFSSFNLTYHYLELLKSNIKKGDYLFAYISPKNLLSNKGCIKSFEHIANLYGYKNE